jgi:oxygen-independent coproporphyrinogen-3 oxidase
MGETPVLRELHLGGGTPTFFSPKNLKRLITTILKACIVHPKHEFSIEGHPNNTTVAHLTVLAAAGFRRISYGVQDNDPEVQRIINRIQPFENVKAATINARAAGFTSINFDLIYGLPLQTETSIIATINKITELFPDRIAFYSYAHVPWVSKGQRLFDESHLPEQETKLGLYLKGKELLLKAGYADIGMDHFALPGDELYKAKQTKRLHRNFMGYTTKHSGLLLGLGVSAISYTGDMFAQNQKTIHDYYAAVNSGSTATVKGYKLTVEDQQFRKYIQDIACKGETTFMESDLAMLRQFTFPKLTALAKDGLVEWNEIGVKLTPQGHYFIRNVCSAFDLYLVNVKQEQLFSKAI